MIEKLHQPIGKELSVLRMQYNHAVIVILILIKVRVRSELSTSCMNSVSYTPPDCKDHPDGYGCDCGPGFHWNTITCTCKYTYEQRLILPNHVLCRWYFFHLC